MNHLHPTVVRLPQSHGLRHMQIGLLDQGFLSRKFHPWLVLFGWVYFLRSNFSSQQQSFRTFISEDYHCTKMWGEGPVVAASFSWIPSLNQGCIFRCSPANPCLIRRITSNFQKTEQHLRYRVYSQFWYEKKYWFLTGCVLQEPSKS